MYDVILRLQIPKESNIVAFVDDAAVVVVGKQIEDIVHTFNDTIWAISRKNGKNV